MAKLKITKTGASGIVKDAHVSPIVINGTNIGGTGGLTSQANPQIAPTVFVTGGSQTAGSIVTQKGAHKFLVTDGTNTGICTLTNSATLTAGQMSVQIGTEAITSANLVAVTNGATSTYVTYATANVAGPAAIAIGDTVFGFTGNASTATVTAINATVAGLANVTVSVAGNVTAQTTNITVGGYASRITNKFVYDFNGNKYRYHLATPDTIFVQVSNA